MNDFEAKRQARIERYRVRAEKLRSLGSHLMGNTPEQRTLAGMMGEPIKVGHHSEGRHRRLIEKAWRQIGQGVAAHRDAERLESRAAGAESNTAIYSDDPEALAKLREELATAEALHKLWKQINAAHKAFLKNPASLDKSDLPETAKQTIRLYKPAYSWEPHPVPPYRLSNHNATIKRIRERIAKLEQVAEKVENTPGGREVVSEGPGWKVVNDYTENRVMIEFRERPSKERCQALRRHGFKWSPTRKAWVRHLGNHAIFAAELALKVE